MIVNAIHNVIVPFILSKMLRWLFPFLLWFSLVIIKESQSIKLSFCASNHSLVPRGNTLIGIETKPKEPVVKIGNLFGVFGCPDRNVVLYSSAVIHGVSVQRCLDAFNVHVKHALWFWCSSWTWCSFWPFDCRIAELFSCATQN
jgi:hypothetical protein